MDNNGLNGQVGQSRILLILIKFVVHFCPLQSIIFHMRPSSPLPFMSSDARRIKTKPDSIIIDAYIKYLQIFSSLLAYNSVRLTVNPLREL